MKPFADAKVGGVTTNQRILDHDRNVLTRWADWLENIRIEYSMPAMSVLGQVGCLPGRTIAFRRTVLDDAMPAFLNDRFLGVFLEVSDDRTLTNLCLKQGYQDRLPVDEPASTPTRPSACSKMAKQQLRWARGSQYNTLRMLPWMMRQHADAGALLRVRHRACRSCCSPRRPGSLYRGCPRRERELLRGHHVRLRRRVVGTTIIVVLTLLATWISAYVRQSRHFDERPARPVPAARSSRC